MGSIVGFNKFIKPESRIDNSAVTFRQLLRSSLFEAPSGLPAKNIAEQIGIGYASLANSVNSSLPFKFSASRLPAFLISTQDIRIVEFFADLLGCGVFPRSEFLRRNKQKPVQFFMSKFSAVLARIPNLGPDDAKLLEEAAAACLTLSADLKKRNTGRIRK